MKITQTDKPGVSRIIKKMSHGRTTYMDVVYCRGIDYDVDDMINLGIIFREAKEKLLISETEENKRREILFRKFRKENKQWQKQSKTH